MGKEDKMFGKENEMRPEEGKLSTIIANGTKIVGNIDMEGSIRIDGFIQGKVSSSDTLTVGKTGVVDGEVIVKVAIVGGKIKGNLVASQKVELESKATILGDVKTRIFVIKEGGIFHGKCSMREQGVFKEEEKGKGFPAKMEQEPKSTLVKPETSKPIGSVSGLGKS